MTSEDFCANCTKMLNQLLAQGFTRPIYFAALASDGLGHEWLVGDGYRVYTASSENLRHGWLICHIPAACQCPVCRSERAGGTWHHQ